MEHTPTLRHYLLLLPLLLCTSVRAQTAPNPTGKAITVADMQDWNRITDEQISADGAHVLYTLTKDVGDPVAVVYNTQTKQETRFPRLHEATLNYDGTYLIGLLKPAHDTVRHIKLTDKKKAEKKLALMDSLLVWDLRQPNPVITPRVHAFMMPERDATTYAYTTKSTLPDSLAKKLDEKAKRLVVRKFTNQDSFYLEGVMSYVFARDAPVLLAHRTDKDSTWLAGVHRLDTRELRWLPLAQDSLDFAGLALSVDGERVAFLSAEVDESDEQTPYQLNYWRVGDDAPRAPASDRAYAPEGYAISKDYTPRFSEDGTNLFFGNRPRRADRDTTLLDDEIADVEVWRTEDPRLYTQENVRLKDEQKRTYLAVYRTESKTIAQIADATAPYVITPPDLDGDYVATYDDRPYAKQATWEGFSGKRDLKITNLKTGAETRLPAGEVAPARFLAGGDYLCWYNATDTTWNSFDPGSSQQHQLTTNDLGVFYDELNDRPMDPRPYDFAGTLADGRHFLINDRYDLWQLDAAGRDEPRRLTRGREQGIRYELRNLDRENNFVDPDTKQLVTTFREENNHAGFGWLDVKTGTVEELKSAPKSYGSFAKARNAAAYVFTEADFRQFPDLRFTPTLGAAPPQVSDANPQQSNFRWGTAENYSWIDNQGRTLKGLLIKPDGFDPTKKYPLLVNFYERNSEGVFRHRTPVPGRSSINYAHYASKGYVIFNPDVIYRVGYPGESAYDCVMSGITSLLSEGYVDRERIGAQGHSWGGYQVAYLATKTDIFAAIESGAPVVNMFSAYGGIRWGSGLSRQFQYERTQSRIGGSPWEYPLRYIENSPIFTTDKINTPLLILHNDADGAVPWYQGIEWFTALRRLDKKAWLLNYRGEPHWPVKTPNRADFQTRMAQFFDHYLMDGPMPRWMRDGVSPLERGIEQGFETASDR
ncbi:alpha/beta hydrolase family protein [Neolewinella antarctica]|uniref:Dipeptidyl aminopeptidase/acylaminoacyl peptidase n=1 Tax=Neolewinella antarctica TaxID=442734 RepID=A0ABX0XAQ0_9BACT|nr:prolyl oligopeptidase family serine peptidase [Neolewinella antarctica]NJC26023.1 dipeptidyl aminopeptidase/acylaminoacyl peptidase [Neolewinella antarctica]